MDHTITNLTKVLAELEVDERTNTMEQRLSSQKAIYLAQAIGVNLHYPYEWHPAGPQSRELSADLHDLVTSPEKDKEEIKALKLREPFASALSTVLDLTQVPKDLNLSRRQWMQLLASVHHLRKIQGLDERTALQHIQHEADVLQPHADRAAKELEASGML